MGHGPAATEARAHLPRQRRRRSGLRIATVGLSAQDLYAYASSPLIMPIAMDGENIPSINESRLGFHRTAGHLNYFLDVFGDHIAQREGYGG